MHGVAGHNRAMARDADPRQWWASAVAYQDIDRTFGRLEVFDELLAAVHARGMKPIMDIVVNHTSDEHRWFVQSRSSKDSDKRDWYWWLRRGRT